MTQDKTNPMYKVDMKDIKDEHMNRYSVNVDWYTIGGIKLEKGTQS